MALAIPSATGLETPDVGFYQESETRTGFLVLSDTAPVFPIPLDTMCDAMLRRPATRRVSASFTRFTRPAQEPGSSAGPNVGRESMEEHEPPEISEGVPALANTRDEAK